MLVIVRAASLLALALLAVDGTPCSNDTACYRSTDWRCTQVASGGGACHINGEQPPTPPYQPWPVARCACTGTSSCVTPPPHPPASQAFGCHAGRCIPVASGGTANSTASCEWATGCVELLPSEWLADKAEFRMAADNRSLTCTQALTFLKKSELPSGTLPADEKRAVAVGATLQLAAPPKDDGIYFLIALATESATPASSSSSSSYLMIGDSISLGYLPGVVTALAASAIVTTHSAGNAGNANNVAHELPCYLRAVVARPPAVITWNAGIHDLALGQEWLSLDAYTEMVTNVSVVLAATTATIIFVTTTPVPTNSSDASQPSCPEGILDEGVRQYNAAAAAIAVAHGATVLDLHGAVTAACGGVGYTSCALQKENNPHFLDAGWELLSKVVAAAVRNATRESPTPTPNTDVGVGVSALPLRG